MSDSNSPDSPTWRGQFAKGFIPDPEGHRTTSAIRLIGIAPPPSRGSVNQFSPPIRDQGGKSQCTGEGGMGGFVTSCNAHGVKLPFPIACPSWSYKVARAVDRSDPNIPLIDDGAMPNQMVRGLQEFGILGLGECSDADADVNEEPTVLQVEKASQVHGVGWHILASSGKNLVLDMMRAIGPAQVAVPASSDVDSAFEDYNGKGVIPAILKGENLGGHFYYFTEFQTTTAGSILFRFRNSWTVGWGEQGTGWVNEEFIMRRLTSKFTASAIIRGAT